MLILEIAIWCFTIIINLLSLNYFSEYYGTTELTKVFHLILIIPYPYWGIVLLSAIGTFLSIHFGDEMIDIVHHDWKTLFRKPSYRHKLIIMVVIFAIIIIGYYELITSLGLMKLLENNKREFNRRF